MGRKTLLIFILAMALALGGGAATATQESPPDRITLEEFKSLLASQTPVLILDVRHQISSKIKGAKHIPVDQIETRLAEIPREHEIVTYCA